MTTTWYKASAGRAIIEPVQVERDTDKFVFIRDPFGLGTAREKSKLTRLAKTSEWSRYFQSWSEAHAYLLEAAQGSVTSLRRRLEQANGHLGNIKGMKNPETNK